MINKHRAFTIIELLTVLVIIALLITLLLPSISAVRRNAKDTAQKAQFLTIETALDAFKQDYGDYPPSDRTNPASAALDYCGSSKLVEALAGMDFRGFDPCSVWRSDGRDALNNNLYVNTTLFERKGPYLDNATSNIFRIGISAANKNDGLFDLFAGRLISPSLDMSNYVLCDTFGIRKITDPLGKTVLAGNPILYYKANPNNKNFVYVSSTGNAQLYNYSDNRALLLLGKLNENGKRTQWTFHPLAGSPPGWGDGYHFYESKFNYAFNEAPPGPPPSTVGGSGIGLGLRDPKIQQPWPYKPDSYILISAGADGLYGTADDIHNNF